jgi:DNA polymerase-3 subunit chi
VTEIRFHFSVPSRTEYACRLLRKASRQAAPVAVTGPEERLAELDRALWAMGPADFIAHAWARDVEAVPQALRGGIVWLAPDPWQRPCTRPCSISARARRAVSRASSA